jgi:hypothetical protein
VNRLQATQHPYPYVQVESDGVIRELSDDEREYLETPFYPSDGARPFVKPNYEWRNALGDMAGFLARDNVPEPSSILVATAASSHNSRSRLDAIAAYRKFCDDVIEHDDGSITVVERKP